MTPINPISVLIADDHALVRHGLQGILADATQKILHKNSNIKIIILSSLEKPEHIKQAMQAGAKGYLIKNTLPQEMIKAIHTVAQGGYHFQNQAIPLCSPPCFNHGSRTNSQTITQRKRGFSADLRRL